MVVRLRRGREIAPEWMDAVEAGLVGVCPVVEAELTRSVASEADRDQLREHLRALFAWRPTPESAWRFVQRIQDDLVHLGQHKGLRWSTCSSPLPSRREAFKPEAPKQP